MKKLILLSLIVAPFVVKAVQSGTYNAGLRRVANTYPVPQADFQDTTLSFGLILDSNDTNAEINELDLFDK